MNWERDRRSWCGHAPSGACQGRPPRRRRLTRACGRSCRRRLPGSRARERRVAAQLLGQHVEQRFRFVATAYEKRGLSVSMTPSSSAGRASFPTKPSPPRSSTACFTTAPSSAFSGSSWPREAPRGLSYPPQSARTPRPHQSVLPLQVHSSGRGWPSTHPTVVPPEASPCNPARSYGAPWQSAAHPQKQRCRERRLRPAVQLLLVEAVAQRNSGVHRSQSPLEAILTDVIYGSLGAFDGQAGLI
jgi:hypothetical protein